MTLDEINEAVAVHVIGWEIRGDWYTRPGQAMKRKKIIAWSPTTDPRDAMRVVDHMTDEGWAFDMGAQNGPYYNCHTNLRDDETRISGYGESTQSLGIAISLAALRAKGVEVEYTEADNG